MNQAASTAAQEGHGTVVLLLYASWSRVRIPQQTPPLLLAYSNLTHPVGERRGTLPYAPAQGESRSQRPRASAVNGRLR